MLFDNAKPRTTQTTDYQWIHVLNHSIYHSKFVY